MSMGINEAWQDKQAVCMDLRHIVRNRLRIDMGSDSDYAGASDEDVRTSFPFCINKQTVLD